jgi:hypothetical protein
MPVDAYIDKLRTEVATRALPAKREVVGEKR